MAVDHKKIKRPILHKCSRNLLFKLIGKQNFKEGEYLNAKGARIPSFKLTDVSYYVDFNFEEFKKEDFIKEEDWTILKERFLKIDILTY